MFLFYNSVWANIVNAVPDDAMRQCFYSRSVFIEPLTWFVIYLNSVPTCYDKMFLFMLS